ncbi:MAG: glycoside hydrolase family 25 protein [Bacteroidetes bacterium]|nr:glycoside hydrolase family 25 protein [Bacteroidota bacterium]MBS1631344.1 glycoside hydrolase family 25 protein [Bacteroidota bacterium]
MSFKRKKKIIRKQILFAVAFFLFVMTGWILYQRWQHKHPEFVSYPEFGIIIPDNYSIHGIDVSKYQRLIAWEEVQAMNVKDIKLGFAFMKATEGIGNTDPQFQRNWKRAKQAGMVRGAYHFFIGSKDGKMQAENFINTVDLEKGDLPPVLDVEQANGNSTMNLQREIKQWLETVENYYQVRPIIYTNVDFYNQRLGHDFDKYPLWIAHYYQPQQPRIDRTWSFWQHSDKGRVNGIFSRVDFNVFNGDSVDFKNLLVR